MSKTKKLFASTASVALVAAAIVPAASAAQLNDIEKVPSYAKEAVQFLADNNILQGDENGNFNPAKTLSRAEAAQVLMNALELKAEGTEDFSDVSAKDWFYDAVVATSPEIFNGDNNGKFNPKQNLTREAAAKVLVDAYGFTGSADLSNFADASKVSKWANSYVAIAVENGIISGKGNLLAPQDKISRAEFATMVKRAMDKVEAPTPIELVVDSVVAIDANTIEVTFEDGTVEEITLEKALKDGATKVTFEFDGKEYTEELDAPYKAPYVAPAVESVSAINGGELVVKFNKAVKEKTVITNPGTDDTLVDGIIKINNSFADAYQAKLSEDGKTLTIFADSTLPGVDPFDGAYTFELLADKVKTTEDKYVEKHSTTFSVKDETRAAVTGVKIVSKYVFDITLSEPVQSTGDVTAKYKDGKSVTVDSATLRDNNKTIRVTLNSATDANKEITVSIPSLTDAKGNISAPTSTKVTVSDADKVKPTVVSAVATSDTEVEIKFSEELKTVDDTLVKLNGNPVGTGKAVIDDKDGTVLKVTVSSQTTSAAISLDDAAVTDLSGNGVEAWNQVINFTVDKSAPKVTSSKVVKKADGFNYLQLQFNEKVKASVGGFTDLTFKYQDEYGVTQPVTVPSGNVSVDSDDNTIVNIKLADNASTPAKLKADVDFKVEFGKGYFLDLFNNEFAKKEITFTNNGTASETKLRLAGTPTNGITLEDGAYVEVDFAAAVDPATAKTLSNYEVEGAEVSKVELVSNNSAGAKVRVFLKDGSVEATGYYNVTVTGVKGYNSSVTQMDTETKNIEVKENVRATVKNTVINFTGTATTLDVTFTESVKELAAINATDDFTLYVDGKATTATVTGDQDSVGKTTIQFTINDDLAQEIADGKSVKLVVKDTLNITDLVGNKINVSEIVIK